MHRPQTTREEALALISALVERRVEGEPPPLSDEHGYLEACGHLRRLPPAATLPLHARAMFAPSTLDARQREHAGWSREDFFAELGRAVGLSARALAAAIRMGRWPLAPPREIADYEYLGSFRSSGQFDVSDPCYLRRTSPMPAAVFSLSFAVEVARGVWHAYVRAGTGDADGRTAELAAIHVDGLDAGACELVATIGVDGGMAGVFDRTCPEPSRLELHVEGVVQGLGVFSCSGYGDGIYPVYAGKTHGMITKLRLPFVEEDRPEVDLTLPRAPARPYAATATFTAGERVTHPKFGVGTVYRVHDGKIEIEFADAVRTLVHGRARA
jgi:hypothetical protein